MIGLTFPLYLLSFSLFLSSSPLPSTRAAHLSASSGAAIWIILHYYSEKKWTLTEIMNGAFAGLAAITPGSGFVVPWTSVLIGGFGSACSFFWVTRVKPRIGVDDALDVAALQGVPGILGTFMVGLFAESKQDWNSIASDDPNKLGLFRGGNGKLLAVQTVGVVVTVVWTFVMTYMLMIWMRRYVGIDVSPECKCLFQSSQQHTFKSDFAIFFFTFFFLFRFFFSHQNTKHQHIKKHQHKSNRRRERIRPDSNWGTSLR